MELSYHGSADQMQNREVTHCVPNQDLQSPQFTATRYQVQQPSPTVRHVSATVVPARKNSGCPGPCFTPALAALAAGEGEPRLPLGPPYRLRASGKGGGWLCCPAAVRGGQPGRSPRCAAGAWTCR